MRGLASDVPFFSAEFVKKHGGEVREIVRYPDWRLGTSCTSVELSSVEQTQEVYKLVADLVTTLQVANGYGLAAPQVGVAMRVFVVDLGQVEAAETGSCIVACEKFLAVLNPRNEDRRGRMVLAEEGCLSLPGERYAVTRPAYTSFVYMDVRGQLFDIAAASGLLARVLQHELDHLHGCTIRERAQQGAKSRWVQSARQQGLGR